MHAGCGNHNGVGVCSTFCQNMGSTINVGWDVPCGTGYPSGINAVVADGGSRTITCLHRSTAVVALTDYTGFNQATTCGNPMFDCVCDL
jgi:hypothetical protein